MCLDKQPYKNQNMKNVPQHCKYSSNNAVSSFKQAKCYKVCQLENYKNFEQNTKFTFLSASQSVNRDQPSVYTAG